jgi:hypothetical protein
MPQELTVANQKLKLAVYGQSGVGKTTFLATAYDHPDLAPALILDFEGGLISVAYRGRQVKFEEIHTWQDLEKYAAKLWSNDGEYREFKSVIVDSASEMVTLARQEAVEINVRRNRGGENRDKDDIELGDYSLASTKLLRMFRMLRDLNRHIFVSGFPRPIYKGKPPNAAVAEIAPGFATGALKETMIGLFDYVFYMYKDEDDNGRRKLLTVDYGLYRAKTRGQQFSAVLGQVLPDPTLPAIYDLLLKTEDPLQFEQLLYERQSQQIIGLPAEPSADDIAAMEAVTA